MEKRRGRARAGPDVHKPQPRKTSIVRLVPVHAVQYECVCWECGAPFTARRPDAKYDSHACREKAYRERKKARAAIRAMQEAGEPIFASPLY
jgi:hypothetical protein